MIEAHLPTTAPGQTDDLPVQAPELATVFPALAHLLGPEPFAALCRAAATGATARDVPAGALMHGLLVRRDAPLPETVPARLAADIAALEWSIRLVPQLAPRAAGSPRATPAELDAHAWRVVVLEPVRAFDIVPVAFRLENWVRRLHEGRRVRALPVRQEQHVVVHVPAMPHDLPQAARVDAGAPRAWWFGLDPKLGRLLGSLALGTPLGSAVDEAIAHGDVAGETEARTHIDAWLREGLFARATA